MRLSLLAAAGLWVGGCAHPPPAPPAPPVAAQALPPAPAAWVDAFALEEGDGSERRPFKTLQAALAAAAPARRRVALRPGLYRGPFAPPDGVRIEGPEAAVLYVEGAEGAVVAPAGSAELEGLSIQGGEVGLRVGGGRVAGRGLHFSGQRGAAVQVEGGELDLSRSQLRATLSEVVGVGVGRGRARVAESRFQGPFRRAVAMPWPRREDGAEAEAGDLEVIGCRFEQAVTAVHAVGGRTRLEELSAWGGRGPAIFLAGGAARIRSLWVDGHEYALQARGMAALEVEDLIAVRSERAGVAVVGGRATLEDVTVVGSGEHGAVAVVDAEVGLRRFRLHRVRAYGIIARGAGLEVRDGEISEVLPDAEGGTGDALHLRDTRAVVERVAARAVAGLGLHAAEGSRIQARSLLFQGCRWGGLAVESLAELRAASVMVQGSGGAALAVPGEASAWVDLLTSERNAEGALWAECAAGAQVRLTRVREDGPRRRSLPCVREPGR